MCKNGLSNNDGSRQSIYSLCSVRRSAYIRTERLALWLQSSNLSWQTTALWWDVLLLRIMRIIRRWRGIQRCYIETYNLYSTCGCRNQAKFCWGAKHMTIEIWPFCGGGRFIGSKSGRCSSSFTKWKRNYCFFEASSSSRRWESKDSDLELKFNRELERQTPLMTLDCVAEIVCSDLLIDFLIWVERIIFSLWSLWGKCEVHDARVTPCVLLCVTGLDCRTFGTVKIFCEKLSNKKKTKIFCY